MPDETCPCGIPGPHAPCPGGWGIPSTPSSGEAWRVPEGPQDAHSGPSAAETSGMALDGLLLSPRPSEEAGALGARPAGERGPMRPYEELFEDVSGEVLDYIAELEAERTRLLAVATAAAHLLDCDTRDALFDLSATVAAWRDPASEPAANVWLFDQVTGDPESDAEARPEAWPGEALGEGR